MWQNWESHKPSLLKFLHVRNNEVQETDGLNQAKGAVRAPSSTVASTTEDHVIES